MSSVKFSKQELTKQSRTIIAASDNGWFKPSDFKGQSYVPHNPRNNRKTKKGGKK